MDRTLTRHVLRTLVINLFRVRIGYQTRTRHDAFEDPRAYCFGR